MRYLATSTGVRPMSDGTADKAGQSKPRMASAANHLKPPWGLGHVVSLDDASRASSTPVDEGAGCSHRGSIGGRCDKWAREDEEIELGKGLNNGAEGGIN